jgi:hypothetical protein
VPLRADDLITALSACTTHIGLGATVSTSFSEPFNVARIFGSIDHLSGGRAAWNVVTSSNAKAALNFNRDEHMEHELRYARAKEFVDVVTGLWDCWEEDAIVADKATGQYVDADKVRPLNHKGRFFQVKGPLNHGALPAGASGDHPGRRLAFGAGTGGAHRRCRVFGGAGIGTGEGRLCRPQRPHGEIRPRAGPTRGAARGDAGHRRNRRRGAGETRQAAKLDHPDQRDDLGREPDRLRRLRP